MPNAGDEYTVILKEAHLKWGTHRNTDSRDRIDGEAYIPIPADVARQFNIYNSNHTGANTRYKYKTESEDFAGTLLAQGCSERGDVYAKQFSESGNLQGIGDWYRHVNAVVGGKVTVHWDTASDITISYRP